MYIDNVKFARAGQELSGEISLADVARIQEIGEYTGKLNYQLTGSTDKLNRPVLNLAIYGIIGTLCQNCLQAMDLPFDNNSQITVFYNEDELDSALFGEEESDTADGVLAEDEFDVMQLVEDEIIISLPYSSRHESCIGLSYHDDEESPFSALKHII